MSDDGGLRMWKVEIHNPEGLFVRTMLSLQTDNQNDVRMAWDGRDESGELVDNGFYNYTVLAIDTAGNVSPSCGGVIEVDSVLDPGEFP